MRSFRVRFLNTDVVYCASFYEGKWYAHNCNDDTQSDFLANRLNGLTRDDSGAVKCLPFEINKGTETKRYDSSGRDVTGLTGLHDESDTEWQVIRNPPLDMVLLAGDESSWNDRPYQWFPLFYGINMQFGQAFSTWPDKVAIRRRLPLPADFDCIPVESLSIQGMLKSRRLARSILDAGWGQFIQILTSKAESAGCQVIAVNPKNTSQECSACGQIVHKDLTFGFTSAVVGLS